MTRNLTLLIAALMMTVFASHPVGAQQADNVDGETARQQLMAYWLDRGAMALSADQPEQARMAFERALMVNPRASIAHASLGRAQLALDHITAATKYLRTALDIDPQNLDALHWAGLADLGRGDVEKAKQRRDKLLTLCSSNCDQYKALAVAINNYADQQLAEEAAALNGDTAN